MVGEEYFRRNLGFSDQANEYLKENDRFKYLVDSGEVRLQMKAAKRVKPLQYE